MEQALQYGQAVEDVHILAVDLDAGPMIHLSREVNRLMDMPSPL